MNAVELTHEGGRESTGESAGEGAGEGAGEAAGEAAGESTREWVSGQGMAECQWQAWAGFHTLPRCSLDDLLPATGRLVVLAPHPDDEILACGGLLALHAARGGSSLIVAATDGEASHDGVPGWNPHLLAARRCAESRASLAALGIVRYAVLRLGLRDGGVAAAAEQLESRLKPLLRENDLLLSTWRRDGHPDHDACGHAAGTASSKAGCRLVQAPVWMWHWASPGDARVPWQRLHALPLPGATLAFKRRALAEHHSQLAPRTGGPEAGPVLDAAILERAERPAEYFFL